jgi:hypothetical protein
MLINRKFQLNYIFFANLKIPDLHTQRLCHIGIFLSIIYKQSTFWRQLVLVYDVIKNVGIGFS